jgi:hypothetical protein
LGIESYQLHDGRLVMEHQHTGERLMTTVRHAPVYKNLLRTMDLREDRSYCYPMAYHYMLATSGTAHAGLFPACVVCFCSSMIVKACMKARSFDGAVPQGLTVVSVALPLLMFSALTLWQAQSHLLVPASVAGLVNK